MSALTAGRGVGGRGSGSLVSPFALRELSPYAWFDAHVSGGSDGMPDISGNGRGSIVNAAGSNAALWLPYTEARVHIPNNAGNYVKMARSSVATPIVWEVAVRVSIGALGVNQYLGGWESTHGVFRLNADNKLVIYALNLSFQACGNYAASIAVPGLATNTPIWLRGKVTAADANCEYWYSNDNTNDYDSVSWTEIDGGIGSNQDTAFASAATTSHLIGARSSAEASGGANTFFASTQILNTTDRTDWEASSTTQTGGTSTTGNVITVGRATSGRKTVVESLAAVSDESLFLYGPDDYQTVPADAIPALGTSTAGSFFYVVRDWGAGGNTDTLLGNQTGGSGPGFYLVAVGAAGSRSATAYVADAVPNTVVPTVSWDRTADGLRCVVGVHFTSTHVYVSVNGTRGTAVARPPGSIDSASGFILGGYVGGAPLGDHEGRALLTFDRNLNTTEVAKLVANYRGGL